jgi:hypothetical protein
MPVYRLERYRLGEDAPSPGDNDAPPLKDEYEAVTCPACTKLHFVNRRPERL